MGLDELREYDQETMTALDEVDPFDDIFRVIVVLLIVFGSITAIFIISFLVKEVHFHMRRCLVTPLQYEDRPPVMFF